MAAIDHWMAANRLRLNPEKTELTWVGSKHSLLKVSGSGSSLTLSAVNINAADVVRVLGVLLTPDLSLDRHIKALSAKCFFQLRQLRRIRRSLDDDSVATLVHALSSAVLTTVSGYWRVLLRRRLTSYSVSSTLLHGLYQTVGSTTGV